MECFESEMYLSEPALKKLKLQKEFVIYLDEEDILKDLELTAIRYEKTVGGLLKENFIPPFRFQLKLDIIKIQEVSENLLHLFVKEPEAGTNLAKNVIFNGVQLLLPNFQLEKSDIQVVPLIINLPVTCKISDLLHYPSLGLECFRGVLMSRTTLVKYVRSSVFSCAVEYCPRNKWQRYPENFGNICPECLSLMEEDISSTDTGEQFICQLLPLEAYHTPSTFQVLNVRVKGCVWVTSCRGFKDLLWNAEGLLFLDELCTLADFCIGDEYKIAGKFTGNIFEAMSITNRVLNLQMEISFPELPKSIAELHQRVSKISQYCPWSFAYALSSVLGSHIIPTSSYLHLKMGLMLGLCSQKSDEAPTPLFAVGPDSLNAQLLFHAAGKLSERYVRHSVAHSYLGGAAKPGLQPDIIWLEAGQLILASKGVCNLGDWSKLKKEQANYVCQTIESGQIVLNKGELGKNNLIDFVPLKCAVWTYWCHITTSRTDQLQLKTLINVFGIPFLAEEKDEEEVKKICWKNLGSGTGTSWANLMPQELKEFVKIINAKELCLSEEASQLIRNYFVVSRRERQHCLPMGAIKTITSLAEAHARLSLRNEVLYEDVVAIIYLYEEAISALFGETMNSFTKLVWDQEEPIYSFVSGLLLT